MVSETFRSTAILLVACVAVGLASCASVDAPDLALSSDAGTEETSAGTDAGKPDGLGLDVGSPGQDSGGGGDMGGGGGGCANPVAYYPDFDGDGYGDANAPVTMACMAFAQHVTNRQDCDDSDAAVHPGTGEVAGDGVDQNCDGVEQCFIDADDDGYRTIPNTTMLSADADCDDPGEALLTDPATDCDDEDPLATPGGVELCNGADDDCDGAIDNAGDCPCPVEVLEGRPWMFCSGQRTWMDALAVCQGVGYTLATIRNGGEDGFAYDQIGRRGFADTWIGYNDRDAEGTFTWISGEPPVYQHWDGGEPNDGGSNGEDCAVIMTTSGRETEWDDRSCGSNRPFICQGQ